MSSCCKRTSNAERLWQAANVDIKAIEIIISSHFRTSLTHHARMDDGAFACVFLFSLENGMQVGVIDWEMAGFRPAWLATVSGGWFDDDSERFLMSDFQGPISKTRVGTMPMRLQPTLRSARTSGSTWRRWTRSSFATTCRE